MPSVNKRTRKSNAKSPRWLQVAADGEEFWFDEPHAKSLRVVVLAVGGGTVQQTWTYNVVVEGPEPVAIRVTPRGGGWTFHRGDGRSSVWRRPLTQSGRPCR